MDKKALIIAIKKKKELAAVADSYITDVLNAEIARHRYTFPLKEKDAKLIMKSVRAQLRRQTGMFSRTSAKDKLDQHRSTHERKENYALLHRLIAQCKPESILDLGCGLNPLEIASAKIPYYAYDINEQDVMRVQMHLDALKNEGFAKTADIQKEESFPHADLCIMLKLVDLLDKKGHKNAEHLIDKVGSHYMIISFSTKTISGKQMNHPQRGWIERLCARKGYTFTKHISSNEIFYLIERH
jgi:hypothetical protein